MAGITKTLTFAEGVVTSGPTTTFLQTTQFATYANDAAFVTAKGSAAADGDAYYDTTLDVIKIYANASWQSVYDDSDANIALLAGTQTFSGDKTFSSAVNISDTTQSTDKDTGALIIEGGVGIEKNVNIGGDLTVAGTTTSVDDLTVTDETITVNSGGNQATADSGDAGLVVDMSDATNATIHYDSTATSKWKAGEVGSTKEVVTISDIQQLTNKDIDGGTASNTLRITLPKGSTSALDALTRKEGTLVFDTDVNKVKYDDGSNLGELGGGAGGINYITGGDAEGGTTGWADYADVAGPIPVDGTGGSPTITWTQSASAPLRGSNSFLFTKDAADRQGEGTSFDFDIDNADIHSVMTISFDATTSANYADDDMIVYMYNTDSSNLIEPVPMEIKAGENGKYSAQFQTDNTDNSYRLILHVSSTNASAYTVKIDNIKLGPSVRNFGTPITDQKNFIPTGNFSTNATYSGKERRVGGNVELDINITFSGATDAVTADIDLPHAIDTTRLSESSDNGIIVGQFVLEDNGTDFYTVGHVYYHNTDNKFRLRVDDGDKTASDMTNTNPFTIASGDNVWLKISYPVSGWGSNVQMSDSDETRVVACRAKNSTTSITNGADVQVVFNTVDYDTHSFYNSSTGEFIIPVSGKYRFASHLYYNSATYFAGATIRMGLKVNGGVQAYLQDYVVQAGITNSMSLVGSTTYNLVKGDSVFITSFQNTGGTVSLSGSGARQFVSAERISGPSGIMANELVACRYQTDAGQSIPNATWTRVVFEDISYDTHGIMNISTGVMTVPVSGKYLLQSKVDYTSASFATGTNMGLAVYKNAASYGNIAQTDVQATITAIMPLNGTATMDLIKGDTIAVYTFHTAGAARSLYGASIYQNTTVSLVRLGF